MGPIKGKYIIKMNMALQSLGVCLILSTCSFSFINMDPLPTWYNRNIHGMPVLRSGFSIIYPSWGEGLDPVYGKLRLEETSEGVFITGAIFGLKPGLHGFHVHQEGNLLDNCKASGGHFNPSGVSIF